MRTIPESKLINAIAERMQEHDVAIHNDVEPWDYYTEKALVAAEAYADYLTTPYPQPHYVEGLTFLGDEEN